MITYLFDGLTQQTTVKYNIQNCKRHLVPKKFVFTRVVNLHLPLFLTIPLWKRHGYSMIDIHTTLEFFSSIHLWQCALLYGISASNSAIKLAFATPESMVYGSKAIVIRKIEKVLKQTFDFRQTGSVLDTVRDDHIPPLPLHRLDAATYLQLLLRLPKQPVNMLETIYFDDCYNWNGIQVVPLWMEKDALYCVRIINKTVFSNSGRVRKQCLSNRPLDIVIKENSFAGVEEAMFFISE
jgi:hypothetical protein